MAQKSSTKVLMIPFLQVQVGICGKLKQPRREEDSSQYKILSTPTPGLKNDDAPFVLGENIIIILVNVSAKIGRSAESKNC